MPVQSKSNSKKEKGRAKNIKTDDGLVSEPKNLESSEVKKSKTVQKKEDGKTAKRKVKTDDSVSDVIKSENIVQDIEAAEPSRSRKTTAGADTSNGIKSRKQKKESKTVSDEIKSESIVQDVEEVGPSRSRKTTAGADTSNGIKSRKQKKESKTVSDVIKNENIVQDVEAAGPSRSRKPTAGADTGNGIKSRKQKKDSKTVSDVIKTETIVEDVEAVGPSRSRKTKAGADTTNGIKSRKQKKESKTVSDVIKSENIVQDVEATEPSRSRKPTAGADTDNGIKSRKQKKESKTVSDVIKSESIAQDVEPAGPSRPRKRKIEDENQDQLVDSKVAKVKKTGVTNATVTIYNEEDFGLSNKTLVEGDTLPYNLKISSWNVAGLRSWLNKDGLTFLKYENPDIFCIQETKCTIDQLPEEAKRIPGYHPYWLCMAGGYAGVAVYSKIMPINVEFGIKQPEFDDVGRAITAEYEKFFLINVYVPNSGRKLVNLDTRMIWEEKFKEYIQSLDKLKPVIICGDMNVAHNAIDLKNPKTNTKTAGFTKEEREKMTELLASGFVDTFRHFYPDKEDAFTFWSYMRNARAKNVGWRLDYFLVSERIIQKIVDNCIRQQCLGSDHCPITLYCKF
ncbi:recombination repair protein 1 [Teleopsis dalmanni]|uniref:recombination repair protein 1 n=1 Tax=Teleopsis dalmanni TaxID=139649 RepID=UPI0018CCF565|nr:recombination repair protein 1 [Teleopsis dalmanni]